MKTIADRIRWARHRLDWSQIDLAKRVGVSVGTIGNLESGARQKPRNLLAIARALGVPPDWLESGQGYVPDEASPHAISLTKEPETVTIVRQLGEALAKHSDTRRRTLADLLSRFAASPGNAELAEELAILLKPPGTAPAGKR